MVVLFWLYWYNENNLSWSIRKEFIVQCSSGIGQCIIARIQRCIQNPVKHVRWIFRKNLTIFGRYLLLGKAPSNIWQDSENTSGIFPFCLYWLGSVCDSDIFSSGLRDWNFQICFFIFHDKTIIYPKYWRASVEKDFINDNIYRKYFFILFTMKIFFEMFYFNS